MPFKSSDAVQIFTSRNNYSSNGYILLLAPLTTLQYLAFSCTVEYFKPIHSLHAIALQKPSKYRRVQTAIRKGGLYPIASLQTVIVDEAQSWNASELSMQLK